MNWIIDQKLMIGMCPRDENDIILLEKKGITFIVNLMTKKEKQFNYSPQLKIGYISFPIKHASIVSDESACEMSKIVVSKIEKGNCVFIHSKNGNGRVGVISAIVYYLLYPKNDYYSVLLHISSKNTKIIETADQFNQLNRIIEGKNDIFFYNSSDKYYFLSNFYSLDNRKPLFKDEDGKEWLSSEAYYQAAKFDDEEYKEYIRKSHSSYFACMLGKQSGNARPAYKIGDEKVRDIMNRYKKTISKKENWREIKDGVMYHALYLKFTQNEMLKLALLETHDKGLCEYTHRDGYWATFWNKPGCNKLGKLLIKLRNELK